MTQNVEQAEQAHMEEITLDDAELVKMVVSWAALVELRRKKNKEIQELGIDDVKAKIQAKLEDFNITDTDEVMRFRAANTRLVITVTPPGQPKEVAFTSSPKLKLTLRSEGSEE